MLIPTIPIGIEYLKSLLSFSPLVLSSRSLLSFSPPLPSRWKKSWSSFTADDITCMDGGVWMGEDGGKKEACTYISIAQLHR